MLLLEMFLDRAILQKKVGYILSVALAAFLEEGEKSLNSVSYHVVFALKGLIFCVTAVYVLVRTCII